MPQIYQLSSLAQVSSGDQIPVYAPNNGDARRMSVGQLLQFFQQGFAAPDMAVNFYTPTTGFSLAAPSPAAEQQWMLLQPAGTLASGSITLPLNTQTLDGAELLISSTQEITSFSLSLNGATAAIGVPAILTAGSAIRLRYYNATNTWYSIAEVLSAPRTGTGSLVFSNSPSLTTPSIGAATGDSLLVTDVVGYSSGVGGSVIQATSKSTSVTLDAPTGQIRTSNASLGANSTVAFTLNNTFLTANDTLVLNHAAFGTFGGYSLQAGGFASGSCLIAISNLTGGALAEAIDIRYAIVRGDT
jgi:hypothetical protein